MENSKTVLKCNNCDPSHELGEMNKRWQNKGKLAEYCKNFVGIQIYTNSPQDYDNKLDRLICPFCNNKLIDTGLPVNDFHLIGKSSDWNRQVLDAMMELYKKDPIEYQLKFNQFKLQQEQKDEMFEKQRQENLVHCPYCNSTNLKRITTTAKAVNIAMFGLFGNKRKYQWHCNNCKTDF